MSNCDHAAMNPSIIEAWPVSAPRVGSIRIAGASAFAVVFSVTAMSVQLSKPCSAARSVSRATTSSAAS